MLITIVETSLQLVIYAAIVGGALLLFDQVWGDAFHGLRHLYYSVNHQQVLRMNRGFRSQRDRLAKSTKRDSTLEHLDILLKATLKKTNQRTVVRFVLGSLYVAIATLILAYVSTRDIPVGLLTAVLVFWTPYLFLRIRKYHLAIQNSYTIGDLVNKILPEYRRHDGSMLHTLKSTAEQLPRGAVRRALVRLANHLTDHSSSEEAKLALNRFSKELGTSWAAQIANDIEHAMVDGVNVEYSLALMHKEFTEIEKVRKDQNLSRMDSLLVAMVPFIMWPLMMLMFYFDFSRNILVYQFDTPAGFMWFFITLISTLGSFLIGLVFYKPKQDI